MAGLADVLCTSKVASLFVGLLDGPLDGFSGFYWITCQIASSDGSVEKLAQFQCINSSILVGLKVS